MVRASSLLSLCVLLACSSGRAEPAPAPAPAADEPTGPSPTDPGGGAAAVASAEPVAGPPRPTPVELAGPPWPEVPATTSTCRIPDEDELARIPITTDVVYATIGGQPLHVDLAQPEASDARPAVLVIHGGGWQVGEREHVHGMIRLLALQGMVGVALEYRLTSPGVNTFPAAISDARCAVRFLRAHAAEHRIDPARIGALGFSAGGHLAALLATAADVDGLDLGCPLDAPSPAVQAVVSYFAPTDMRVERGYVPRARRLVSEFLGATPSEDPARAALASPIVHVDASDPPTLLVHGTADRVVPLEQASMMRDALTAAGVPTGYLEVPGGEHGFTLLSNGPRTRAASCTSLAFLRRMLRLEP